MATLTLTISKLRFPGNANISNPITVTLEYKEYYSDTFTLVDAGVNVDVDGTILESPLPTISVDPTLKYVIRCTNELCDFQYEQTVIINPYCPVGYEISDDDTYCFIIEETEATPPTSPENTVAQSYSEYTCYGSLIYDLGFNVDGTGPFTQIDFSNVFWVNGTGFPSTAGNTTDGPLNRSGLWATTVMDNQDVGYAVCLTLSESGLYYVGMAADDYATIKLDGTVLVQMDTLAMNAYLSANGYPGTVASSFRFWHIYPIEILSGTHILEIIGHNLVTLAAFGAEIYKLTSSEIQAATSYVDMGTGLVFSTKDEVGNPVQLGSDGIGYSCPVNYSLAYCESPVVCRRLITTPVLY